MKFAEKYPNAKPGQEVESNILFGENADNCAHCGRMTNFIDMAYEAHFCSEECIDAFDNEVFKYALRK